MSDSLWPHVLYGPPGSSVHGILQARILEWVAIFFSRGSSQPRDWTQVSCTAGRIFTMWAGREAPKSRTWPQCGVGALPPAKERERGVLPMCCGSCHSGHLGVAAAEGGRVWQNMAFWVNASENLLLRLLSLPYFT